MAGKGCSRNWTNDETNLFCKILADPVNNFMATLEKKVLKKASTKEVFKVIAAEFSQELKNDDFKFINQKHFNGKRVETELAFDLKRLQRKYNNIKQHWQKLSDRRKNGSGLTTANEPEWCKIVDSGYQIQTKVWMTYVQMH